MYISLILASLGLLATTTAFPSEALPSSVGHSGSSGGGHNGASSGANSGANSGTTQSGKKYKHFDCGTHAGQATDDFINFSKQMHHSRHKGSPAGKGKLHQRRQTPISVDTYFHIVTKQSEAGSITQQMATDQFTALNKAYNRYGITFNLKNTTFTVNDTWAVGADPNDLSMNLVLRQGTYNALNIFFQTDLAGGVLGKCSLPATIQGTVPPSAYASDCCNVNANTMPGGNIQDYNLGQTAVHETGHWMGLLHVFENYSCSGDGDYIADTPMQSIATSGCPPNNTQDSCPMDPGYDNIHNIMDYSYDICYLGFTGDQVTRMQDSWTQYRVGH